MKIKDFLNLEDRKVEDLTGKDKAGVLLTSVINELTTIGSIKKSDTQKISEDDYRLELLVTMQLLEYYIDSGNFNLIAMPYPDTKEAKERNNEVKAELQRILIK